MKTVKIKKKLLSLVMGDDVVKIESDVIRNGLVVHFELAKEHLNLDTLGRLCKEWCWKNYFITIRSGIAENGGWSNLANDNSVSFVSMDIPLTEFEAIIKATEWVANKKGLMNENS